MAHFQDVPIDWSFEQEKICYELESYDPLNLSSSFPKQL